jgi:hypothetical protein
MKRPFLLVVLGLAGVAIVCAQSIARPSSSFRVGSTLDGMKVLPHHLHWIGHTSLPAAQIGEVDFLIDGKLAWVEHKAPYVYSGDEDGQLLGYLVTSWLTPGSHRFTVRAVAKDGRQAEQTVVARPAAPAAVPPELAGSWRRTIPHAVPSQPGVQATGAAPAGAYTITFSNRWIEDRFPGRYTGDHACHGCLIDDDWVPSSTTFRVWGSATIEPQQAWRARGGWWCNANGPAAAYRWSVDGDTLTLEPVGGGDACQQRGTVWTGTWTRVH